jgi:D-alanine-D-alanine ligase
MQVAMKKVAVVMGGTSHEAEISLRSGAAVLEALTAAGYQARPVVLTDDNIDGLGDDVDAVYIALHGGYGEGGGIQADLDARGIPYTGPGAKASALCMDKEATKAVLAAAGLPVPPGCVVTVEACDQPCPFALPVVVKPPRDGSSVGLSKVTAPSQWAEAVRLACAQDPSGEAMCEAYIDGRELAVGVVHGKALPVLEIIAPDGWYDYRAKYTPGLSQHVYPTHDATMERLQRLAEQACAATGCRGAVRVDFRLTAAGEPYILEINTAPGCTATSLLPDAAARAGIPFPAFCASMIERAQCGV